MSYDMTPVQSGMSLEAAPSVHAEAGMPAPHRAAAAETARDRVDFFQERDGIRFAGSHLIVDLWGATHLDEMATVDRALREAADASGATLLHLHLHRFTPNGGISGVAVLAESHISIHTWPERHYAALDVFMCGSADPRRAIPVLSRAFEPERVGLSELLRGQNA
jgi:S-adenosylmethionine decarboxylase